MNLRSQNDASDWKSSGSRFYTMSRYLRRKFGCRVRKLSLDAGLGCPNADGTLGRDGCVFCNIRSFSPSRRQPAGTLDQQIVHALGRLRRRQESDRYLAYFQPGTNTYAPIARLREAYEVAARHPLVAGIVVGTRPDCVGDDVLDLLAKLSERTWLLVEYGLQSIHDRTLDWIGRGHHVDAFYDAVARSHARGLRVGAHVILGLPGESRQDMIATAQALGRLAIHTVKIHNLYAVRDTRLAELVLTHQVTLLEQDEYVQCVADFLEHLAPDCVIDRLSGDAPPEYLIAPTWCSEKSTIRCAVQMEFEHRSTQQGSKYLPSPRAPRSGRRERGRG